MTKSTPMPSQGERGSEIGKLIERLKRATGPDRELDGEIKFAHAAFLIAEGKTAAEVKAACGGDLYDDPLPYTESIDAALTLVPNWSWRVGNLPSGKGFADLGTQPSLQCVEGATPAIALTLAALKARQATGG